mgnify:CR=1
MKFIKAAAPLYNTNKLRYGKNFPKHVTGKRMSDAKRKKPKLVAERRYAQTFLKT